MNNYKNNSLKELKNNLETTLIIHYSSQSLNDGNEGYSPRITSIVVHNLESRISHSFSIHLEAEIKKVAKEDIEQKYDMLEKSMLDSFYSFIKDHPNHCWVHWNMRNIHYGFEMLEHRYKVLGASDAEIVRIRDRKRFNLSDIILDVYGDDSISHPRMAKLMDLNGGEPKGFLSGENEAKAFENKEYVKLHESTLCKVGWFRKMLLLLIDRKIKTEKSNWQIKAHEFCDSVFIKILGVISAILGIPAAFISALVYFFQS